MATETVCTTIYGPAPVMAWSPAARVSDPIPPLGLIEFHVDAGDSIAVSVVDRQQPTERMDKFLRQGDSFLHVTSDGSTATLSLIHMAEGGNQTVWSIVHSHVDTGAAAWFRIVRSGDGTRWGVHSLHTPGTTTAEPADLFDWGQTQLSYCDVAWAPSDLDGDSWVYGWLQGSDDVIFSTKSGLTGSETPAAADYLRREISVQTAAATAVRGLATPSLTIVDRPSPTNPGAAPGRTRTRAVANEDSTPVGRTLTAAATISFHGALGTSHTRAPRVTAASGTGRTLAVGEATPASGAVLSMPISLTMASDDTLQMDLTSPVPTLEMTGTMLGVPSVPEGMILTLPPLSWGGMRIQRIKPGEIDADMPVPELRMGDYAYGGIEVGISAPTLVMRSPPPPGVARTWREFGASVDSWTFQIQYDEVITEEATLEDALNVDQLEGSTTEEEAEADDSWTFVVDPVADVAESPEAADSWNFYVTPAAPLEPGTSAWAVNLDTGASSRYEGYGFNSFFERDGVRYGVASDGIYRLDADRDSGEHIEARLYVVQTDFGSDRVKYVPKVYVGGTSARPIHVTMSADGVERTYQARNASANLDVHRVDLGVGVKANYWGVTIENTRGADFAVDSLRMTPVGIRRRI